MSNRVAVTYGGHVIDGEPSWDQKGDGRYEFHLSDGAFLCGPHDVDGNHITPGSTSTEEA